MTVTDTSSSNHSAKPANMHTDAQGGATPLNMHTDVVVSSSGSTVTITGRSSQGTGLRVTMPKRVADKMKAKVPTHVTASTPAKASATASLAEYDFDTTATVTGDATQGLVVTGPITSGGVTRNVALEFTPNATSELGAQRANL